MPIVGSKMEIRLKRDGFRYYGVGSFTWLALIALMAMMILASSSWAEDKIRPEEIVAKHLESIGAAETLSSVHTRIMVGTVVSTFQAPATARFTGRAVLSSAGDKSVIGMGFENSNYPYEKFGYDGADVTVGYTRPGVRSNLGDFVLTHKDILKYGLIGGTLSAAWPLMDLSDKKEKLEYGGIKKFSGKSTHELRFIPHGGSDLQISLFFDTETFRHLRTEYTRVISALQGSTVNASASQRTTRYKMVEEFSDFRKESGLILPHTYKLGLNLDTRAGTFTGDWEITLTRFAFNQPIEAGSFNVSSN